MGFIHLKIFFKNIRMRGKSAAYGFSMLELVVSIAIMLFVGAQVLVMVRPLDNTVSLNRAAQELGYAIRRAQAMSLAVSAVPIGGIYKIPPSIGIVVSSASGDNGHYLFFSDLYTSCPNTGGPDKRYDSPCERIEPDIIFPRGITIKSINGMVGVLLVTVSPGYIIFKTPEATMSLTGIKQCGICLLANLDPMNIVLTSSSGETRTIRIRLSGQITILNP